MNRGQYASSSIYPRRQSTDIFRNDPFKIQSYNFRYAEKPVYQTQHYQRQNTISQVNRSGFETYYQNPNFNEKNAEPTRSSTDVVRTKHRSYLRDLNLISSRAKPVNGPLCVTAVKSRYQPQNAAVSSTRLSASGNRIGCDKMVLGLSNTRLNENSNKDNIKQTRDRSTYVCSLRNPDRNFSTTTFKMAPKGSESSCSNCAINININGLLSEADSGNRVNIHIETDPCIQRNTDDNGLKVVQSRKFGSTDSMVIDKHQSKCNLAEKNTTCNKDTLLQLKSDRKYLEQVFQQRKLKEQERSRERERENELLKEMERREHERMLKLESYEKDCEAKRWKEFERIYGQRQLMRAFSMPTSVTSPLEKRSQLDRPASAERLPGMVPFSVKHPTVNSFASRTTRPQRLQPCTNKLKNLECPKMQPGARTGGGASDKWSNIKTPKRKSSSSSNSNCNANVLRSGNKRSADRPNEPKLLNLLVNGVPVSTNRSIETKINNMPIRITTSQTTDENLRFSLNKVRNSSPGSHVSKPVQDRRHNFSRSRNSLQKSSDSINVNINVYADEVHPMRL